MKGVERSIDQLIRIVARLRSPTGCPWDREQTHRTIRWHSIEEVYELVDAIENEDDHEMAEELGDLLLQVVFHCELARERKAFDFEKVASLISEKLVRRHPHVFGNTKVKDVDQVWANWERIKRDEKHGTKHARPSALDGIPKHLPALMRAEKLLKKAQRAGLQEKPKRSRKLSRASIASQLYDLVSAAQASKWSAEELLRSETLRREKALRRLEKSKVKSSQKASSKG